MKNQRLYFASLIVVTVLASLVFPVFSRVEANNRLNNPASDIERGIFVHYPKAKGGGADITPTEQVSDFKYSGIHWLGVNPQVPYSVNPYNPGGLAATDVITAIAAAFQEWNANQKDGDSNINFVYSGATSAEVTVNPVRDVLNTVSWESLSSTYPNAIAVTFYWYNRATKGVVEADTVFNSDLPWSINAYGASFSGSYDLQNIATHEFGHWLVLGDLYQGRDRELTMYGYGAMGETKKDTLGRGDILGIQKAY